MKVRNQLKILMAKNDIRSVMELSKQTGLYYQTLLSFYHERYEFFNTSLVGTLCEFFNCNIEDLLTLEKEKAS
jgi:putative transcriptional regulator